MPSTNAATSASDETSAGQNLPRRRAPPPPRGRPSRRGRRRRRPRRPRRNKLDDRAADAAVSPVTSATRRRGIRVSGLKSCCDSITGDGGHARALRPRPPRRGRVLAAGASRRCCPSPRRVSSIAGTLSPASSARIASTVRRAPRFRAGGLVVAIDRRQLVDPDARMRRRGRARPSPATAGRSSSTPQAAGDGTMSKTCEPGVASLYRVDPGAGCVLPDSTISNGIAWSLDGGHDVPPRGAALGQRIDRYDFDGGELGARREFTIDLAVVARRHLRRCRGRRVGARLSGGAVRCTATTSAGSWSERIVLPVHRTPTCPCARRRRPRQHALRHERPPPACARSRRRDACWRLRPASAATGRRLLLAELQSTLPWT